MVCNVNESMAKELQLRIDRCNRSFVWLERIKQRFSAMDPDNRDEPRMARIMAKCCERSFWSFLGLETFIGDLCAAMGWKRSNGESGDGKPLAQQVETKVGSLPEAALNAIVAGGLAGVLNEAVKISAVQRYSQTMMKMLEDSSYYEWGLKDWVDHLKAGRKTILLTPAWAHIKRWREENKRERLSE